MQSSAIMRQFRELSTEEKLEVIDTLWAEAARELRGRPLSDAEREFLDQRLRDASDHADEERDWQSVRAELLGRP